MKRAIVVIALLFALHARCARRQPRRVLRGRRGAVRLFVTVRTPQVIPGIATIEIRSESPDVTDITVVPMRLTGPGSELPSVLLGMRVAILPLAAETEVVPPRSFRRSTRSSVKGGAPCPRCRRRRGHGSTISRSGSFRVGWWIHARPTGCARPRRGGGNRTVTAPPTPTPVPSRFW